jgi:hypothetical protein
VQVQDGSGLSATGSYTLQVSDASLPLAVLSGDLVTAEYASPYVQQLSAVGGVAPYTWTLTGEGRLPGGVTLAPDGTLEGIPRESGSFAFTVNLTDAASPAHTVTAPLTLIVSGQSLFLRAASPNLPDATLDQPYTVVLGVSGGFPPYYWAFPYCADPDHCAPVTRFPAVPTDPISSDHGLPRGLYFSCDFTGTVYLTSIPPNIPPDQDGGTPCYNPSLPADAPSVPKEAGIFAIPGRIHDSANQAIEVTFSLRVGTGAGLSVTTTALPDALQGKAYSHKLQSSGPSSGGAVHWGIACAELDEFGAPVSPCPENLPPGLTLADDGTLSGTSTDTSEKTYTFLVRAGDDEGRADVRALAITSKPATAAPKSGCGAAGAGELGLAALPLLGLLLRRRRRALPALGLALVALLGGCGKTANTRCTGVTCTGGLTCDPGDGQCKCGGEGGVVCAAGQLCDTTTVTCSDPAHACADVACTGNTACDPADGQCKCGGAGGVVCASGTICNPATRSCSDGNACVGVVCPGRQSCDISDGTCKCDGQLCGAGQVCSATEGQGCVASACAGVQCTGNTVCDEASGACLCGGSLCVAGQTCGCPRADGGLGPDTCDASARACVDSTLCAGVACHGGSTCDPADGLCKCGGPGGPQCGSGQNCDVSVGACIGGDRCRNITCATGTSCDPEDGQCKCGGQGGQVCGDDQSCFQVQAGYACRTSCDPLQQNCDPSQACYFDESASASAGYCATPGTKTDTGNPPPLCNSANDCAQGYHCVPEVGRNFPGTCHRYCAVSQGAGGCTGSNNCVQLGNGAPDDVGACEAQ